MRTAKLIAQRWLTTAGAISQALGESTYQTATLLALALQEPKQPARRKPAATPREGPWWERTGLTRDAE